MVAAFFGSEDLVQLLLDKGADVNAKAPDGNTALSLAKEMGPKKPQGVIRKLELAATRSGPAATPRAVRPPADDALVMSPGMRITAKTSVGTIAITAVDEQTRSYTWEGATRAVERGPQPRGSSPRPAYSLRAKMTTGATITASRAASR